MGTIEVQPDREEKPRPKLTERLIAQLLMQEIFPARKWLGVRNVSWGFEGLGYEIDLVVVSSSDYAYEIEIKVSLADLRRDLKKDKHKRPPPTGRGHLPLFDGAQKPPLFRGMYYAMPLTVWEKVKDDPPLPMGAGVIVIQPRHRWQEIDGAWMAEKLSDPTMSPAAKLSLEQKFALARLGALRQWRRQSESPS